jgi:mRNA-degrading endonuclease toxin of MazEF toxin-antitoxin module
MTEIEIKPKFGEVYKCAFYTETVGSEVKGYRPVLVISAKWYNEESERITVLPLTRAFNKEGQPKYVYAWEVRVRVNNQEGKILTDQIHNIDKQRLEEKIDELSSEKITEVMKKLRMLINFFPEKQSFIGDQKIKAKL